MFDSLSKSTQIALFIKQQKDPELLEMQIKYPEFRELLDINDLQQIIDCFPNKKMINN